MVGRRPGQQGQSRKDIPGGPGHLPNWAHETAMLERAPGIPAPCLALAWAGSRVARQVGTVVCCSAENEPAGLCVLQEMGG